MKCLSEDVGIMAESYACEEGGYACSVVPPHLPDVAVVACIDVVGTWLWHKHAHAPIALSRDVEVGEEDVVGRFPARGHGGVDHSAVEGLSPDGVVGRGSVAQEEVVRLAKRGGHQPCAVLAPQSCCYHVLSR